MSYQLDVAAIAKSFHIGKGTFTIRHNPLERTKFLPYTVKFDENKQLVIAEAMAEFGRLVNQAGHAKALTMDDLLDRVLLNPSLDVSPAHRSPLKELLQSLFFTETGQLHLFHPKILLYLPSGKENAKMGAFLRDIFWISDLFDGGRMEEQPTDVTTKLLFESLPSLETINAGTDDVQYQNVIPEIAKLFMADYSWLSKHPEIFVAHLDKLMTFYYFFYVSQFALSCKVMFSQKERVISPVYFNLESESISQMRTSYLHGWKMIEDAIGRLFTHINCLEMLNHTAEKKPNVMTYRDIAEQVRELDLVQTDKLLVQLDELLYKYRAATLEEEKWELFRYTSLQTNPVLDKMYELERTIDFQFLNSDRKSLYDGYTKWFTHFCQKETLLKSRGRLGKTLNLNYDYLLFLTKLILKDRPKIRLKQLFYEFEVRGVLFDRDTQKAIVEYFERINILDKKSDSGDAKYVKSFL